MKNKLLLFALMSLLIGCNKTEEKKSEKKLAIPVGAKNASGPGPSRRIQTFADLPEELDGPGCIFSFSEKDYIKGERHVYADNLDSICYIKVKGDFVRLRMVEIDTSWFPTHYAKKFRNEDFELSIDVKKIDEEDEVSLLKGTMFIKYRSEPEEKKELYGFCGC